MICACVKARTNDQVVEKLLFAKKHGADLAEVRVDCIDNPDLGFIISRRTLPLIITIRPAWEGGLFRGTEDERYMLLKEAGTLGAEFIDQEFKSYKDILDIKSKVILSYHNFEATPHDIAHIGRKMSMLNPFLLKIACKTENTSDIFRLLEVKNFLQTPFCLVPVGEEGQWARILYKRIGSFLTYASLLEESIADGQVPLEELVDLYRVAESDEETAIYGVVGNPVSRSKGHLIFNYVFEKMGLNAIYVRFHIDTIEDLAKLIQLLPINGLSITSPFKQTVMDLLDEFDEAATAISAVNTVIKQSGLPAEASAQAGRLKGYNTDVIGAMSALKQKVLNLRGKRALIIGAGGVARAIVYGLVKEGAQVFILNRTKSKAEQLGKDFNCNVVDLLSDQNFDVIINATPVHDSLLISEGLINPETVCFDCIYNPNKTTFLKKAESIGASIVYGKDMFIKQAIAQFEIFFGKTPDDEIISLWSKIIDAD